MKMEHDYSLHYTSPSFWNKLQLHAKKMGSNLTLLVLKLYYSARDPKTPKWARARIYAALGYFVFPLDLVPDFIPATGYSDDLALLTLAVATLAFYITDESKAKAKEKVQQLFKATAEFQHK